MKKVSYAFYDEKGERTYYTEDTQKVYKDFSYAMRAKYFHKSPVYHSIRRHQNYDGTCTYTVYQEYGKAIFTVEE